MGLLEMCKKYFNTINLYEIFEISSKATDKEGKMLHKKTMIGVLFNR